MKTMKAWWAPLALACAFVLIGAGPVAAQIDENDYYDHQDDEGFLGLGDEWPFGSESEYEEAVEDNDYYSGYYDDEAYDDDWYYDYYDSSEYGYADDSWYGSNWWEDDSFYDGGYDDESYDDDWFYDEYESGHYDWSGYDDAGESGLFDW